MGALVFTLGASEPESVPALPTGPGRQSSLHSGWHRRGGLTGRAAARQRRQGPPNRAAVFRLPGTVTGKP